MVLFPGGWPAGETVRFERIRIKGAFTVSATATGAGDKADGSAPRPVKLTSPVRIASLAGQNLTVAWWAGSHTHIQPRRVLRKLAGRHWVLGIALHHERLVATAVGRG